ncbi:MAG: hypothetical protein V1837_03260 [Candidatus Woesearchaeota archaeon]
MTTEKEQAIVEELKDKLSQELEEQRQELEENLSKLASEFEQSKKAMFEEEQSKLKHSLKMQKKYSSAKDFNAEHPELVGKQLIAHFVLLLPGELKPFIAPEQNTPISKLAGRLVHVEPISSQEKVHLELDIKQQKIVDWIKDRMVSVLKTNQCFIGLFLTPGGVSMQDSNFTAKIQLTSQLLWPECDEEELPLCNLNPDRSLSLSVKGRKPEEGKDKPKEEREELLELQEEIKDDIQKISEDEKEIKKEHEKVKVTIDNEIPYKDKIMRDLQAMKKILEDAKAQGGIFREKEAARIVTDRLNKLNGEIQKLNNKFLPWLIKAVNEVEENLIFKEDQHAELLARRIQEHFNLPKFVENDSNAPRMYQNCLQYAEQLKKLIANRNNSIRIIKQRYIPYIENKYNKRKIEQGFIKGLITDLEKNKLDTAINKITQLFNDFHMVHVHIDSIKTHLKQVDVYTAQIDTPKILGDILRYVTETQPSLKQ